MNVSIFKAYDIRGVVPDELDAQNARRLGKALVHLYRPTRVLVGCDARPTSPDLQNALVEGLIQSGVNVTVIGLCSTPMFNFAVGEANGAYDLGVMVTASHNPAKYNGFKMDLSDCLPIGQGNGMEELRDLMVSEEPLLDAAKAGTLAQDDGVLARYVETVFRLADLPAQLPPFNVAIDAGNGMNGVTLPSVMRRVSLGEVYRLFWDPDGTFPHHEANPIKLETLKDLREAVLRNECHLGVAFDGDGDRVGFMDETGAPIPGDLLTALFARERLAAEPGAKILYDVRSSWSVPEIVAESGGRAEMCRVGHALIKRQMRETGAAFAGELSMHFYFRDLWNCESSDLAMLLLLKIMAREKKLLSQIVASLRRYAHSGEINFTVRDSGSAMQTVENHYAEQNPSFVSHLDGIRMEFRHPENPEGDWWFSVRASNTEPLLRLNLEAKDVEKMEARKAELSELIESLA